MTQEHPFTMQEHTFNRSWRYVVPPHNIIHIIISQRLDGSLKHTSEISGRQHFHVSAEKYNRGKESWNMVKAAGSFSTWKDAVKEAEKMWNDFAQKSKANTNQKAL